MTIPFRLARLRDYPSQRKLENGHMLDIQAAWSISTAEDKRIGVVLRTPYGDRCASHAYAEGWAGCWHLGDKRECARYYVQDRYWERVASHIVDPAMTFDDRWLARVAYLDGATVAQSAALAKLGKIFLTQFFQGYKAAAEWSSHAPEGSTSEFIDGTGATWTKDADAEAYKLCRQFCMEHAEWLTEAEKRGRPADHLGHDFWLTCAGHGAGFWDRKELDEGDLGDKLTEACKRKPWRDREIYVYRKKIYYV